MTDARTGTDGQEPPPPSPALELVDPQGPVEEAPRDPGWLLLGFGVLWTGFASGVQVVVVWHGGGVPVLILLAFQAVGAGIILLGISAIRSRVTLGWEGDRLCWRSWSPFRSRHRIWHRDEIAVITVVVTVTRDSDGSGSLIFPPFFGHGV
jgi:hypothetical protein